MGKIDIDEILENLNEAFANTLNLSTKINNSAEEVIDSLRAVESTSEVVVVTGVTGLIGVPGVPVEDPLLAEAGTSLNDASVGVIGDEELEKIKVQGQESIEEQLGGLGGLPPEDEDSEEVTVTAASVVEAPVEEELVEETAVTGAGSEKVVVTGVSVTESTAYEVAIGLEETTVSVTGSGGNHTTKISN